MARTGIEVAWLRFLAGPSTARTFGAVNLQAATQWRIGFRLLFNVGATMVLAKRTLVAVIVGAATLLVLSCDAGEQPLAGTSWTLLSIGGNPTIGNVEVEFSDEGGISGWTGCNSYDGRYRTSGSSFKPEALSWTESGCPSHESYLQESLYLDLLVDAEEFDIDGSQLTIAGSDEQALRFARRQ